ncbi:MAG: hypothetical protein ACLQAH_07445 [Limisphaerales bacterium]
MAGGGTGTSAGPTVNHDGGTGHEAGYVSPDHLGRALIAPVLFNGSGFKNRLKTVATDCNKRTA